MYFIAILPPENIKSEIKAFKEKIKQEHDVKHALKLPAHITIQIPFRFDEENEAILLENIKTFSNKIVPFKVELDGFGRFSKNVIFVNVSDHQHLIKLHFELQETLRSFIPLKNHEISSKIHPHLTIAVRDLKRSNFLPIWNEFENKEYKNSFTAKNLVLLKHNGHHWDIIKSFEFKTS
nr:2'-5' RNA ligase family protein [Christiangramia sediminis]